MEISPQYLEKIYEIGGFFIVLLFAINYFNEPKYPFADDYTPGRNEMDKSLEPALPMHMTNRYYYNLYRFAFVVVAEAIYILVSVLLPDITSTVGDASILGNNPSVAARSNALASALIITGAAPNLPIVRDWLQRAKLFLHEQAQIPGRGQDIYELLQRPGIRYNPKAIKNIINEADKAGRLDMEEGLFQSKPTTIEGKWAKLSYLLYKVREWSRDSQHFKTFLHNSELRWGYISKAYESMQQNMVQYEQKRLDKAESDNLCANIETLLRRTYRLISCLLFISDRSSCQLNQRLKDLGFSGDVGQRFVIPHKQVAMAAMATFLAILGGAFAAGLLSSALHKFYTFGGENEVTTTKIFEWTLYGIPFLTMPVLVVLAAKRHYSFKENVWPVVSPGGTQYSTIFDRPWHIYAVVTAVSYVTAAITLILLIAIGNFFGQGKNVTNVEILVWSLVPMVTAAFAAYRIDSLDELRRGLRKYIVLAGGAIMQGLVTGGVIFLAFIHTKNHTSFNLAPMKGTEDFGKLIIFTILGMFIGFALHLTEQFNRYKPETERSERYDVDAPVTLTIDDKLIGGYLVNISKGGALVALPNFDTEPGSKIKLKIDDAVTLDGRTVTGEKGCARLKTNGEDFWGELQTVLRLRPV